MENLFTPDAAALFFARALLGILFAIQGYDKVFKLGIKTVIQTIEPSYRKIRLPYPMIVTAAVFTSFSELIGGLLLLFGLFKFSVLYILGFDLLIVAVGMSLVDPVWKLDIVFPRFLLLLFILIIPAEYDTLTLDNLLF